MNLLSMTLGRIVPRYRTLNEWLEIYLAGLLERQITRKTLINRPDIGSATPAILHAELHRALLEATALLEREVKDATPTATGLTRASIGSFITEIPDGLLGVVGSAQPHVEYVELGTRPHFPPLEPIQDWVRVKFGTSEQSEIEAAALAIARKIAVRGTLGVGMFHRTWARLEPQVQAIFSRAADRIVARMAGGSA